MNKARFEAFSDGVFAIIITILVLEIKVPELGEGVTNATLWHALSHYGHTLIGYFLSVAVISMFWISHHFLFHTLAKNIDRWVVQLNIFFLAIIALIPFSAGLLGTYPDLELARVIYGLNLLLGALCNSLMVWYVEKSDTIENGEMSSRMRKQAKIRRSIIYVFFLGGIITTFLGFHYTSIVLYCIPIAFNNIPGLLDKAEKLLGFHIE